MDTYQCGACFFPYDEEKGLPDAGIDPGTRWEDIPEDWHCPECGTLKSGFIYLEQD
jgi:rubredoxin